MSCACAGGGGERSARLGPPGNDACHVAGGHAVGPRLHAPERRPAAICQEIDGCGRWDGPASQEARGLDAGSMSAAHVGGGGSRLVEGQAVAWEPGGAAKGRL